MEAPASFTGSTPVPRTSIVYVAPKGSSEVTFTRALRPPEAVGAKVTSKVHDAEGASDAMHASFATAKSTAFAPPSVRPTSARTAPPVL
jgi:hypothetical protein